MSTEIYKPIIIGIIIVLLLVAAGLIWYHFSGDNLLAVVEPPNISLPIVCDISGTWRATNHGITENKDLTITVDKKTGVISLLPYDGVTGATLNANNVTFYQNNPFDTVSNPKTGIFNIINQNRIDFSDGTDTYLTKVSSEPLFDANAIVNQASTNKFYDLTGNWEICEIDRPDIKLMFHIDHDSKTNAINISPRFKFNFAYLNGYIFSIVLIDGSNKKVLSGNWDLNDKISLFEIDPINNISQDKARMIRVNKS